MHGETWTVGDFEEPESVQAIWQAPPGIWACSGKCMRSPFNPSSGRYSLEVSIAGSPVDSWPYLEYRFRPEDQDVSRFDLMRLDVLNAATEPVKLQGFFAMPASNGQDKLARLWFEQSLTPGANTMEVSLKATTGVWEKKGDETLPLDWKKVQKVQFFIDRPRQDFRLYFDTIQLTDGSAPNARPGKPVLTLPELVASRFITQPELDGRLDDPQWGGCEPVEIVATNAGEAATERTTLCLGYDEKNLYLGIRCRAAHAAQLLEPTRPRDGNLWGDENLELFLRNGQEKEMTYYHFAVSSAGSQYDEKVASGLSSPSWDRPWESHVSRDADGWSAELVLPWHIFDYLPGAARQWSLNLFRNNKIQKEATALSPTAGGYHNPAKFLPVQLPAPDPHVYSVGIADFELRELKLGPNQATCRLEVSTPGEYELLLRLEGDKVREIGKRFSLQAGQQPVALPFEQEVTNTPVKASMEVRNAAGLTLAMSLSVVATLEPPVLLKLLEPNYRNTLFKTQGIEEVKGVVRLNLSPALQAEARTTVTLQDGTGAALAQTEPQGGQKVTFALPAGALKDGAYRIVATVVGKAGTPLASGSVPLQQVPAVPGHVYVGTDRVLRLDGKPFFALVLYCPPLTHLEYLRGLGFNTAYCYAGWRTPEIERAMLDAFGEKGFYTIASIAASLVQKKDLIDNPERQTQELQRWVAGLKDAKNLLAYGVLDEPNIRFRGGYEPYERTYQTIKAADPNHAVHLVQCGEIYMPPEHMGFADIYEFDYYPGYPRHGDSLQPLNATALRVRRLAGLLDNAHPIWVLFQGYDRMREFDKYNSGRLMTYDELRSSFLACVAEGASGLGFWCYAMGGFGGMRGRKEWTGIARAVGEMSALADVFTSRDAERQPVVSGVKDDCFHFRLKEYNGYLYLLAASTDTQAVAVEVANLPPELTTLQVLGESRSVAVSGGRFSDSFAKYGAHVYSNDPNPPKTPDVTACRQEAAASEQEFVDRNRNNLLHQLLLRNDRSVMVRAKDDPREAYFTLDGMRASVWSAAAPATLQFDVAKPLKLNRLVILSSADILLDSPEGVLRDFTVSIKVGETWTETKSFTGNTKQRVELQFPALDASALLIEVKATNGPVYIDEVEGYCD
jgi:hypothetical protein